ncbi:MAG: iron-sulfur cluster insertion protein ErpA [Pseudomonadota bacterium]
MDLTVPPRVTSRAFAQLKAIAESTGEAKCLRVAVEGGGCSGFQYEIKLEEQAAEDDLVLEGDGQRVLIDPVSLPFLADAEIDYTQELIGARFVINNPNATSSCGCGTSFSI